jgi:hypothetical protein
VGLATGALLALAAAFGFDTSAVLLVLPRLFLLLLVVLVLVVSVVVVVMALFSPLLEVFGRVTVTTGCLPVRLRRAAAVDDAVTVAAGRFAPLDDAAATTATSGPRTGTVGTRSCRRTDPGDLLCG